MRPRLQGDKLRGVIAFHAGRLASANLPYAIEWIKTGNPVVSADVVLSYRVKVVVTATGSSGRILTISLANSDSGGSHVSIEDYAVDMTGAIAVSSNLIGTLSGKWTADRLVTKGSQKLTDRWRFSC